MPGDRQYPCILCKKRTKPNERRSITTAISNYIQKSFMLTTGVNDTICNRCRQQYYYQERSCQQVSACEPETNSDDDYSPPPKRPSNVQSPPSVSLPIPSTAKSHSYCFICHKPKTKLVVVSSNIRFYIFLHKGVIIPAGSRCCPDHIVDSKLKSEDMTMIECKSDKTLLNRSTVFELLQNLRTFAIQAEKSRIDFDTQETLSLADFINLTGVTKENFNDMHSYIKEEVRNTPARSTRTSLGIYLFKMKSGISNKVLSTVFNISKSSIRRAVSSVRLALMKKFVPQHLGLQHISREEIIRNHTRPLAQTLFGDLGNTQAIIVLDGTYIYIQKSGNFQFQRRTFSLHKGRPLIKPMIIVSTTGYFITILGPYLADHKNNDASILTHIIHNNIEDIKNWVEENDIFIVDRGFRDSLELLEDLGIKAEMPCFMKKGQKQMATEDANASRLVTKVRWVVESANARIKRWKYMDHVLPTNQIPFIGDHIRIICAICNKYFPPLSTEQEDDQSLAAKMIYLSKQINSLKQKIEDQKLETQRIIWKQPDDDSFKDFPRLDETDLRNITCGSYQLKLCASYMQEHIAGNCEIQIHKENEKLIRVKLQSRHISSKKYILWIEHDCSNVLAWYCKCRAGARVVGVCAHIAAALWFLGYARHHPDVNFGVKNWGDFVQDAQCIPESVDSSDSELSVIEE